MTEIAETETNREAIQGAFAAWAERAAPITDVFAPDMTWRVEGNSEAAGDYRDRQDFIDRVLAPFGARFSRSDEPFRPVNVRGIYADGDAVIVLWDGRGVANDGQAYENSYAWFMRMRDGLVVDGTAFFDSIHFDDLWTRVKAE